MELKDYIALGLSVCVVVSFNLMLINAAKKARYNIDPKTKTNNKKP